MGSEVSLILALRFRPPRYRASIGDGYRLWPRKPQGCATICHRADVRLMREAESGWPWATMDQRPRNRTALHGHCNCHQVYSTLTAIRSAADVKERISGASLATDQFSPRYGRASFFDCLVLSGPVQASYSELRQVCFAAHPAIRCRLGFY